MAHGNRVPDSVSYPIPGFDEEVSRRNEVRAEREARERAIAADRYAYLRSQVFAPTPVPNGIVTAMRMPADAFVGGYRTGRQLYDTVSTRGVGGFVRSVADDPDPTENPDAAAALGVALTVAPVLPAAKRVVVGAMDKVISKSAMRPGMISMPGRARFTRPTRGPLRFGAYADDPAFGIDPESIRFSPEIEAALGRSGPTMTAGFGDRLTEDFVGLVEGKKPPTGYTGFWTRPRVGVLGRPAEEAYARAQQTIRNIYANPKARDAVNRAFLTGDRSGPIVQAYDSARQTLWDANAALKESASSFNRHMSSPRRVMNQRLAQAQSARAAEKALVRELSGGKALGERAKAVLKSPGSLWADHIIPMFKEPGVWPKVKGTMAAAGVAAVPTGLILAAGSLIRSASERKRQDGGTGKVEAAKIPFDDAYHAITNDARVAQALSDENLLEADLRHFRNVAKAELKLLDPGRVQPVREAVAGYLERVREHPTMQKLISRKMEEYRGLSQGPDFREEFFRNYHEPESQALGEDFYEGLEGVRDGE